jgi:hypothetical protein
MSRPLTPGEVALSKSVFGEAIDYARVRLSTRVWGPWAITFWSRITFPPSAPPPADFTAAPLHAQAWLIHELTHVWQFQTRPLWTVASWAITALRGGYGRGLPGYRYRWPLRAWTDHNLEQQAAMVEHAFMLREAGRCAAAPPGAALAPYRACLPFNF